MRVRDARAIAREWVIEEAVGLPAFQGAYFAGSVNWMMDDAPFPTTSDLDINLVFTNDVWSRGRAKFVYRGVLLEVTPLTIAQISSAEQVLGDYHLAGGFRKPSVIVDPTGHLLELQAAVGRDYATRRWVQWRCEQARNRVHSGLAALDASDPLHDQVIGWLFPTGVTTHVLLVAGLRNPTVRRRYLDVRELLIEYGLAPFHETLLALLGCASMSRAQVGHHLDTLAEVFDAAMDVMSSPFAFASDISQMARPLAIEGSREMIEYGAHREAMFWISVTYSRCVKVLAVDGSPELRRRFDAGYQALLADLSITSFDDLQERAWHIREQLPQVWDVAEKIMAANPSIDERPI